MNLPFLLLVGIIALFVVLGVPRFARAAYLSWFDVERFREVETERVEKLWEDRPQSLEDNTDAWRTRVQTDGWLWYNRIVITISLVMVLGLIIVIALALVGVGPAASFI